MNIEPDAEELAEIAILTARLARDFDVEPRVAMLSFSNFGSARHPHAEQGGRARWRSSARRAPELRVDGEMQADTALVPEIARRDLSVQHAEQAANVLIFPNLEAGNIAYKLCSGWATPRPSGPSWWAFKPVYVLQRGDEVKDIVNMAAIAVVEAQKKGV